MTDINILIDQLSDLDPQVRRFAAKKLRDLAPPEAAFTLSQHLGDNDIFVRNYVTDALIKIGPSALKYVIEQLNNSNDEVRNRILMIYKELKTSDYVEYLIPLIKDEDPDIRTLTKAYLSQYLNKEAGLQLIDILKDSSQPQELRETALKILLSKPMPEFIDAVAEIIENKEYDFFARNAAAEILIKASPDGTHDVFENKLRDECPQVRRGAIITIGRRQGKKASLRIGDFIKDPDHAVRVTTVEILGEIGDPTVIGLLTQAMNDPSLGIWKPCKDAIKMIKERN